MVGTDRFYTGFTENLVRRFKDHNSGKTPHTVKYKPWCIKTPTMDLEVGVFLQQRLNRPVDVVIIQKASPIFPHEIMRKKVRIFEKSTASRAFLDNQSLRAYLDARHYQRKRTFWRKSNGRNRRHSALVE